MKKFLLIFLLIMVVVNATDATSLVPRVTSALVFIGGGSGVIISPTGEIITNHHVIDDAPQVGVTLSDGRRFIAPVLGRDKQGDLALLQLKNFTAPLPYLPLGDSDQLARGDFCLVAGNPLANRQAENCVSFSTGVISALHQFRQGYNDAIVIDAAVNPGNSGGALVNANGELVGICGMTQTRLGLKSSTGAGFAIPVNQLKLWLPFLRKAQGGNVFHGRLSGLQLQEDNGNVYVEHVTPQTPAAYIGLQANDLIVSLQAHHVPTLARFAGIQGIYPAGTNMQLTVERDGVQKTLRFALPPHRPWIPTFTLARARPEDEFPRVYQVTPHSATATAGLRAGDEILAINNLPTRISGLTQLNNYLQSLHLGDAITLEFRRDGEKQEIEFIAE